jgi:hypothetical protein
MKPVEYDVYLCCRHADDGGMVSEVVAGLARLGFRVLVPGRGSGTQPGLDRLAAIEQAPDFLLLSAPALSGAPADGADPRAADLAHAFKARRNILVLADPAHADPLAAAEPPGRPRLAAWQRVTFDHAHSRESIALVGHRLVSSSEVEDRRFMRTVKRAAAAVALMLAVAVALRAVPAGVKWWNRPKAPAPVPRYVLYWTATGQRMVNGQWISFPVADGASVAGGDQIRLAFSPGSDGFAYVVARDTQGGISVLCPGVTLRGASRVRAGAVYQVPGDGRWLNVDPRAGLAAIYLFGGHEPLENLEELVDEADGPGTHAARSELLASTLAGLLDGRHAAVPRPVRTRAGREVVDGLASAPPPPAWPSMVTGSPSAPGISATQTGLLSAVVEITLGPETRLRHRE